MPKRLKCVSSEERMNLYENKCQRQRPFNCTRDSRPHHTSAVQEYVCAIPRYGGIASDPSSSAQDFYWMPSHAARFTIRLSAACTPSTLPAWYVRVRTAIIFSPADGLRNSSCCMSRSWWYWRYCLSTCLVLTTHTLGASGTPESEELSVARKVWRKVNYAVVGHSARLSPLVPIDVWPTRSRHTESELAFFTKPPRDRSVRFLFSRTSSFPSIRPRSSSTVRVK